MSDELGWCRLGSWRRLHSKIGTWEWRVCRAWRGSRSAKTSMLVGVMSQGLVVRYRLWVDTERRVRYPGKVGIWCRALTTRR